MDPLFPSVFMQKDKALAPVKLKQISIRGGWEVGVYTIYTPGGSLPVQVVVLVSYKDIHLNLWSFC